MEKEINKELLAKFEKSFKKNKTFTLAENAVQRNGVNNVAFVSEAVRYLKPIYSNEVKDAGGVTNQKQSGRCWMFAALNVIRQIVAKNLHVKDIELSESYLMFYDKFEKCNLELEEIIEHIDEDTDSRVFTSILWLGGHSDGGYWHFFKELVKKYGVCPKDVMPETKDSSSSYPMDDVILKLLGKDIAILKEKHAEGASVEELRALKEDMLKDIYNVLRIALGKPVDKFTFEYHEDNPEEKKDKDKKDDKKEDKKDDKEKNDFKSISMSPTEFFEKYVAKDLDDYVDLVNWPTKKYPFNQTYSYTINNNVVGGKPSLLVNVPIEDIKEAAIKSLKDNTLLWFACDVGAYAMTKDGYLAPEILDYESVFDIDLTLSKGDKLSLRSNNINHAMTLGGVDLDKKGKSTKWKVINSWGKDVSFDGCLVMSDKWFDDYVFEVVVDKKYLDKKILDLLDKKPKKVEPWEPVNAIIK